VPNLTKEPTLRVMQKNNRDSKMVKVHSLLVISSNADQQ